MFLKYLYENPTTAVVRFFGIFKKFVRFSCLNIFKPLYQKEKGLVGLCEINALNTPLVINKSDFYTSSINLYNFNEFCYWKFVDNS